MKIQKNKKAEIGTTMTGIVATFIIVFIMMVYLFFGALISGKNIISGSQSSFEVEGSSENNIQNRLLLLELSSILKSSLEENGEYQNLQELILYSLDPFIENEDLMSKIDYDINNLEKIYSTLDIEEYNEGINRTDLAIEEIQKIISKRCEIYNLEIPQGFVFPKGYENGNLSDFSWSEWSSIKIPYKENIIEIRYRRDEKC